MHVGVDGTEMLGRATGVGRYLESLLDRWSRDPALAEDAITLFTPAALTNEERWRGTGGASVRRAVVAGRGGTVWQQAPLAQAVRAARPDVFFAPGYSAPLWPGVPVVVSMHDVSFAAHPEWFRPRERWRRRLTATATARRARAVLTISRFSLGEIVRCLQVPADRIHVIPLAVDRQEATVSAPPPPREPMVLYVGSVLNRRHVPLLIRATALLVQRRPDVRLVVVGENRTYPHEDLEAYVREVGLQSQVSLRSWVDDEELASLYARAGVFAFLSEYEGFGLTPLEAMRAGVPAVVLDTAVAREVYGDAAMLVPPEDATVADALEAMLFNERVRDRHIAGGRATAARYSWDVTARETFRLLRDTHGTPGRA